MGRGAAQMFVERIVRSGKAGELAPSTASRLKCPDEVLTTIYGRGKDWHATIRDIDDEDAEAENRRNDRRHARLTGSAQCLEKKPPLISMAFLRWGLFLGGLYISCFWQQHSIDVNLVARCPRHEAVAGPSFARFFSILISFSWQVTSGTNHPSSIIINPPRPWSGNRHFDPIGLGAARNIAPLRFIVLPGLVALSRRAQRRSLSASSCWLRSFGFGAGRVPHPVVCDHKRLHVGKLLAEDIEEMSRGAGRGDPRHRLVPGCNGSIYGVSAAGDAAG